MKLYEIIKEHKKKYPLTIATRCKQHCKVIDMHINPGEEILYAFVGQKNTSSLLVMSSCVVVLTNKRLLIGQKRVLWGYFFTTVTPDMYNDLKVRKGLIWCNVTIDTVKELIHITYVDPKAALEIETVISEYMMKEKQKYVKED